jgi:hypothetical protein
MSNNEAPQKIEKYGKEYNKKQEKEPLKFSPVIPIPKWK